MSRTHSLPVLSSGAGQGGVRPAVSPGSYEKKEKCGVIGIWAGSNGKAPPPVPQNGQSGSRQDVVRQVYLSLYAQQHRGQESAGIAVTDGQRIVGATGMGLVPEVFDDDTLTRLAHIGTRPVKAAVGHNRYSTAGGSLACNAQPLLANYMRGQVALAHNGNLVNADRLRDAFEQQGHLFQTTSDTEVIIHLLANPEQQGTPDPLAATLRRLQGAFSLVFLFPERIEACRDPWGWRPLVLGRLPDGGHVVASESVALDVLGAKYLREVEPGEIVTISDAGVHSRRFAEIAEPPAHCAFEHVYFANPASNVFGQNVQTVREHLGEILAREAPVAADFVMPMPDSGRSAAAGYARAAGLPYREGIVPNRYVGRTFIKPTQAERTAAVRLKLNVIAEIVRGKRVIVVDDSIVRGTTTKAKMDQIREAGAKEIHLRISCPPIRHPCYFGVDFATRDQLVATGRTVPDIARFLGVDSLHYLTLEGLLSAMQRPAPNYCTACWTGDYRLDVDHPSTGQVIESEQMKMFT